METMGDRIKHRRVVRGYSQAELGEKIGVTKQAVSHWEMGKRVKMAPDTLLLLCEVLACTPEQLVYGPNAARRRRPKLLPQEQTRLS